MGEGKKEEGRVCSPEGEHPGSSILSVLRAETLGEVSGKASVEHSVARQVCPLRVWSPLIDGPAGTGQLVLRSAMAGLVASLGLGVISGPVPSPSPWLCSRVSNCREPFDIHVLWDDAHSKFSDVLWAAARPQ